MDVSFDFTKSVDENAGVYFDKAKKAKQKLEGACKALKESEDQLDALRSKEEAFLVEEKKKRERKLRKREWYEKFHWFFSSEGFLCVGGKDATSNELVIKKHLEQDDLVFHTQLPGSPFFVVKNGVGAGSATLEECASATLCYSRAWKEGQSGAEVFHVGASQVTKEAKSGEYVSKGAFMVYGERTFYRPRLEYAFGIKDEEIVAGPIGAVSSRCSEYCVVVPGREKKGRIARAIKVKLKGGTIDEISVFLPSGGCELVKKKRK